MSNRSTLTVAKEDKKGEFAFAFASQELSPTPPDYFKIYAEIHQESPAFMLTKTLICDATRKAYSLKLLRTFFSFFRQ